tara:strand:- start:375 stop:737 length:363 start_codon:yes stop_codon:yes gene_type:complete
MKESDENSARPCSIVSLRVGWILKTDNGKEFLNNILQSGNLEHFDIKPLQLIIEFLFQRYKYIIMLTQLPLYIASHVTYALLLIYMDRFLSDLWANDKIGEGNENAGSINIRDSGSTNRE